MKIKIKCPVSPIRLLSLLSLLLLLSGCGYKPFSPAREDIKNIYIPTFKNLTYSPGVSAAVTDALRREIILDGTFKLTDEKDAQAILSGKVTDFERAPAIYDEEDNIIGGSLTIEAEISFVSVPKGEILWKGKMNDSESVNYFLAGDLARREEEITQLVADKIARRIVERITEPW